MRVGYDSPVFRSQGGELQFTQEMQSPVLFTTTMPGASYFEAMSIDPGAYQTMDMSFAAGGGGGIGALGQSVLNGLEKARSIEEIVQEAASGPIGDLQELASIDIVQSLRAVVGQVATTVGFLPHVMQSDSGVRGTYLEPLQSVVQGLEIANKIISSAYFQQAVDAIAWIPIVGWIIKIVAEVLTLVLQIAQRVRDKRLEKMSFALAQRFHLPLLSADADLKKEYNQQMTRNVLSAVQDYNLQEVFQPPYWIPDGSGKRFETVAARDPEGPEYDLGKHGSIQLTQGWYMRGTSANSGVPSEYVGLPLGAGFMPGGSSLMRMLEFQTEYGGSPPRNIGNYASTARETAAFLWQTTLKPGPAMFAVNTRATEENWTNYLHGMLEYGERCILKGFTVSESSVRDTHRWDDCTDMEWVYEDEYRGDKAGTKRHFPGGWGAVQHFSEMLTYLMQQFWGRGADQKSYPYPTRDTSKDFSPDNYYFHNTVYAHALNNMRSRQMAVVQGYEAFSVFPGQRFEDEINGREEFKEFGIYPAFGSPGRWDEGLIKRWEDTIRLILQNKELWQNVNWRDVPQYSWKGQSPREILKAKHGVGGGMQIAMPGSRPPVPGGPDMSPPPGPPSLTGGNAPMIMLTENTSVDLGDGDVRFPKFRAAAGAMPTASKAMIAGALAMGAVVGVNELYRLGRRRLFT